MHALKLGAKLNNFNVMVVLNLSTLNLRLLLEAVACISDCQSCLYTPQKNGMTECMHRIVVNMVCALLFQGSLPPNFWVEAFKTVVHLINRLPSSFIQNLTPFKLLYNKQPIYDYLRVFGCTCYPNLFFQSTDKLSPRSTKSVFIGYSDSLKGYCCFDVAIQKVIISWHVVFCEQDFYYAKDPVTLSPSSSTSVFGSPLNSAVSSTPEAICHLQSSTTCSASQLTVSK